MNINAFLLLSEQLIAAVAATLLHSLWQGLILVLLTASLVVFTRKRKAQFRYRLFVATLFAFATTTAITFFAELWDGTIPVLGFSNGGEIKAGDVLLRQSGHAFLKEFQLYMVDHRQTVVLVWFLVVVARCVQLLVGLNGLGFLSKSAVNLEKPWLEKAQDLAKKMHIDIAFQVASSTIVKVPTVIGHFKPLILIPIGLLTALPPAAIESILLHELAHIQRRDYLVNLVQSVLEIIFFFNPAVLWLSALIREEREHCCDDMALEYGGNKVNYISALIACQEYQQVIPAYAMGFTRGGTLKERIFRMIHQDNRNLNRAEKSIFATCILALFFLVLFAKSDLNLDRIVQKTEKSFSMTTSTQSDLTKDEDSLSKNVGAKKALLELNAENRVEKIISVKENQSLATKAIAGCDTLPVMSRIQGKLQALSRLDSINQIASLSKELTSKKTSDPQVAQAAKKSLGDRVKDELIADGILASLSSGTSFMLSEKEMIVNGRRIPEDLYHKYREKFVPAVGKNTWKLYYNYSESSQETSI